MALIDVNWRPGRRDLRIFTLLFVLFAGGFGIAAYLKGSVLLAEILWAAAGVVGPVGLVFPRGVWPLYVAMTAVALPIGMVVSTILMILIYFLVLTPIGLVTRMFGYDSMGRRPTAARESYWVERKPEIETRRYFRQY
jgi:hypothetical protein